VGVRKLDVQVQKQVQILDVQDQKSISEINKFTRTRIDTNLKVRTVTASRFTTVGLLSQRLLLWKIIKCVYTLC